MNLLEYFLSDDQFLVNSNRNIGLHTIKYKHLGVDWSKKFMLEARGLVIDNSGKIVARPYKKFFNYKQFDKTFMGEMIEELCEWSYDEDYVVLDKLDGSLAIVTEYDGDFLFCSSGAVEGEYAQMFRKRMFEGRSDTELELLKSAMINKTFMFEYVAPTNKIVLEYSEEKLVLHGIIETDTGVELNWFQINRIAKEHNLDIVKELPKHNLEYLIGDGRLEKDIEGFIVWFKNGKRIKIKTDEYVEKHNEVGLYRGNPNTVKKNKLVLDHIIEGTIDDLLAYCRTVGLNDLCLHIEKVIRLFIEQDEKYEIAKSIARKYKDNIKYYFLNESGIDRELDSYVGLASSNNVQRLNDVMTKTIINKLKTMEE